LIIEWCQRPFLSLFWANIDDTNMLSRVVAAITLSGLNLRPIFALLRDNSKDLPWGRFNLCISSSTCLFLEHWHNHLFWCLYLL
jgi:hypothetical protein